MKYKNLDLSTELITKGKLKADILSVTPSSEQIRWALYNHIIIC